MADQIGARPDWATWFQKLGAVMSHYPVVGQGDEALRLVVSSPTGQYVTWMIAAGSLGNDPDLIKSDPIEEGSQFATWHTPRKRMGDSSFRATPEPNLVSFEHPGSTKIDRHRHPVRRLPAGTPADRGGAPPRHDLLDRLRSLPGLKKSPHLWWARHCISPVVVIGDGRQYLQGQRQELLEKVPEWFSDPVRTLLSEESGQTGRPDRMYFHPFMVLSPQSGDSRSWLRAMKPRLVIVTSWTAYRRCHPSLFAGSPHVIITNRRVPSSLKAASTLEFDTSAQDWSQGVPPPPGVHVKLFHHHVGKDMGDTADDDESDWEL